ncbi:MAG: glycosyltransferase family 4 protein [Saprospiraceae bacterium]|nr:glycosyltransferase family 4 protein [Saprospiraceae bacterium]
MTENQQKRIAIFGIKYFPSRGGTSRVVESLLRHINNDYQITIYCYQHPMAEKNIPGVKTIQFSEPEIKNFGVFFFFCKCLLHLLVKGKYDLVHVHKTEASYFIPFIRLKFPVIATSHEIPYLNSKWGKFGKVYFRLAEWLFMHTGATRTSISRPQCEYYEAKYHKSVLYIPNGVSAPQVCPASEKEIFLTKHSIKGPFLFFAARRIIPLKGCHHFIKALQLMQYTNPVVIAGDMSQMKEYSDELISQSNNLDVRFVDYVASQPLLNALVQHANIFIFPSEIEGMSMMLLEVAILGTPIICSDIPQNRVIFDDSQVLYFKSKDAEDLANKIKFALVNPGILEDMAQKAKIHALNEYGIDRVVDRYKELFNSKLKYNLLHEPAK